MESTTTIKETLQKLLQELQDSIDQFYGTLEKIPAQVSKTLTDDVTPEKNKKCISNTLDAIEEILEKHLNKQKQSDTEDGFKKGLQNIFGRKKHPNKNPTHSQQVSKSNFPAVIECLEHIKHLEASVKDEEHKHAVLTAIQNIETKIDAVTTTQKQDSKQETDKKNIFKSLTTYKEELNAISSSISKKSLNADTLKISIKPFHIVDETQPASPAPDPNPATKKENGNGTPPTTPISISRRSSFSKQEHKTNHRKTTYASIASGFFLLMGISFFWCYSKSQGQQANAFLGAGIFCTIIAAAIIFVACTFKNCSCYEDKPNSALSFTETQKKTGEINLTAA